MIKNTNVRDDENIRRVDVFIFEEIGIFAFVTSGDGEVPDLRINWKGTGT